MPKSLKDLRDLNWPLLIISVLEAVALATAIALGGNFSWKGWAGTSACLSAKAVKDFCTDARKRLEEE